MQGYVWIVIAIMKKMYMIYKRERERKKKEKKKKKREVVL